MRIPLDTDLYPWNEVLGDASANGVRHGLAACAHHGSDTKLDWREELAGAGEGCKRLQRGNADEDEWPAHEGLA
jgi:hypothetical protein